MKIYYMAGRDASGFLTIEGDSERDTALTRRACARRHGRSLMSLNVLCQKVCWIARKVCREKSVGHPKRKKRRQKYSHVSRESTHQRLPAPRPRPHGAFPPATPTCQRRASSVGCQPPAARRASV